MDPHIPAVTRRGGVSVWLLLLPLSFLCLFLFYPLARILALGFGAGGSGLRELAIQTGVGPIVASSASQALASTVLCLAAGLPAAYVFARFQFPAKRVLRTLLTIPFVLPTVVVAAAFTALIGPGGLVERVTGTEIGLMRTLPAVLMAHVFYNVSIVVRIVGGLWGNLDPRLRQEAQILGAGRIRSFGITARLLLPSVLAAAALVFGYCFTSFGVILLLGGPRIATLETEIYRQAVYLFNLPAAAFLSVVQLVLTGILLFAYSRLQSAMGVTMRLVPAPRARPSGAGQWALVAVFGLGLTAALIAPLAILAAGSFVSPEGLTTAYWAGLFRNTANSLFWASPLTATLNSLFFSACAVLASLLVGVPAALLISRPPTQGSAVRSVPRGLLDLLFLLPLGTSAVTLGFGFIVSLDTPPIDLRSSFLLVPIAHALVALPLVTRSLVSPLRSLDPALRQAASVLGASPLRARWEIDLPILRRALLGAAAFAFTVSLGEFAATALLARPDFMTLPVTIYRFLDRPGELNHGQALAMSTLLMVVCAAGLAAIERTRSRGTEVF